MEFLFIAYASAFVFLNVGAGRKFWVTSSTQLGRVLFAAGGAALATFAAFGDIWLFMGVFVGLYLWRLSGWGDFFAAIHGKKEHWRSSGDAIWATKIADKIWPIDPKEGMETKLKSTLDMSIRMALIVPVVAFYHAYTGNYAGIVTALAFPLMGIAYFIGGLPREHKYSVVVAESICGIIIAAMLWNY